MKSLKAMQTSNSKTQMVECVAFCYGIVVNNHLCMDLRGFFFLPGFQGCGISLFDGYNVSSYSENIVKQGFLRPHPRANIISVF